MKYIAAVFDNIFSFLFGQSEFLMNLIAIAHSLVKYVIKHSIIIAKLQTSFEIDSCTQTSGLRPSTTYDTVTAFSMNITSSVDLCARWIVEILILK